MKKWVKKIGPGPLVAAAFIGPGTITMCTTAGVSFGYALLWALLLSVIATLSFQEMASRLGVVCQKDLAVVIAELHWPNYKKWLLIIIVVAAIGIGNTAYEAGNISGGALGLELLGIHATWQSFNFTPLLLGAVAYGIMALGNFKIIQKFLISLVIVMSLAFMATAIITQPSLKDLFSGLFTFSMPDQSILIIVGLIGTTVVPYNLFLHSALVLKKWNSETFLKDAQLDTFFAVILGGAVSMCVLIAAAGVDFKVVTSGADLALALQPVFGDISKWLIGLGLFAAGLTSAITAPMAAAFVVSGLFGERLASSRKLYKWVWKLVLLFGTMAATLNIKPIALIMFAQVANGLFLPVIAVVLIAIMNKTELLGKHTNSVMQNVLGGLVFLITLALSYRILISIW